MLIKFNRQEVDIILKEFVRNTFKDVREDEMNVSYESDLSGMDAFRGAQIAIK